LLKISTNAAQSTLGEKTPGGERSCALLNRVEGTKGGELNFPTNKERKAPRREDVKGEQRRGDVRINHRSTQHRIHTPDTRGKPLGTYLLKKGEKGRLTRGKEEKRRQDHTHWHEDNTGLPARGLKLLKTGSKGPERKRFGTSEAIRQGKMFPGIQLGSRGHTALSDPRPRKVGRMRVPVGNKVGTVGGGGVSSYRRGRGVLESRGSDKRRSEARIDTQLKRRRQSKIVGKVLIKYY